MIFITRFPAQAHDVFLFEQRYGVFDERSFFAVNEVCNEPFDRSED